MSRAKRRTKEEREDILRTVKRARDGTAKAGSVKHAAREAGVSPGTIYGWISRDGWPDARKPHPPRLADTPVPLASGLQALASAQEARPAPDGPPAVAAPVPGNRGQLVATLHVLQGLPNQAIADRVGVSVWTIRRWLANPGPVRDYVNELRAIQRQATVEHVAEVAYYGAKASAGAARIAADMVAEAQDVDTGEPMTQEDRERMEFLERRRVNAIGAAKALAGTFTKAWEAVDVGAINTTHHDTPADVDTIDAEIQKLEAELAG